MQFLRTVFWVVIAVLGAVFALNNWTPVTVNLWSGLVLDTRLPVLMLATFLLGLVPMLIVYRATRWSMKRRLNNANRALTETFTPTSGTSASGTPLTNPATTMPPGAMPIVPPAGVA